MSLAGLPTLILVPPINCLIAACIGAVLHRRRAGRLLLAAGLSALLLLSLPIVSRNLLFALEQNLPSTLSPDHPPRAIVILSGDETQVLHKDGIAFTVGLLTLERERAGAQLARRSGLPVLVSGGQIERGSLSLGELMAISLREDFAVSPQWVEGSSANTWENAANSAVMLKAAGIDSVILVTNAWHMRRALIAFRAAGLHTVAALVDPLPKPGLSPENFTPTASSWLFSYYAMHEWIGCAWYALRG